MGFNTVEGNESSGLDIIPRNQIHVDGTNVKILPKGSTPSVVYRIGDGTVHSEGWDNVDGEEYLDFYLADPIGDTLVASEGQFLGSSAMKGVQYMNKLSDANETIVISSTMNAFSVNDFTLLDGSSIVLENNATYKVL